MPLLFLGRYVSEEGMIRSCKVIIDTYALLESLDEKTLEVL